MYEIFLKLLEEHHVTAYKVGKETGIGASTFSDWKSGRSQPKKDKLQKIADYFNVSIDFLLTGKESTDEEKSEISKKSKRDIKEILASTEQMLKQDGLMFDGQPASQEAIDSILSAMKIGMEMAKEKNKEKYTPKKYKKD